MMTSQDLVRLEAELKRRRTNNRRDVSRNERFCRDSAAQTLKDLDIGSIEHHLEKINTDILIAEFLQNAILPMSKKRIRIRKRMSIILIVTKCLLLARV